VKNFNFGGGQGKSAIDFLVHFFAISHEFIFQKITKLKIFCLPIDK
jgi:hypothetical protein